MPAARSYYETLGVSPAATETEIREAFRRIAKATHPDTHPGNTAAETRYREASEAHATLSDTAQRAEYDAKVAAEAASGGVFDPETAAQIEFLQHLAGPVVSTVREARAAGVPLGEQARRVGAAAWEGLRTPEGKAVASELVSRMLSALRSPP